MTLQDCPTETWWTGARADICSVLDDVFVQLELGRRPGGLALIAAQHAAPASLWASTIRFHSELFAPDCDAPLLKPYVETGLPVAGGSGERHARFAVKVMEDDSEFLVVTARVPLDMMSASREQLASVLRKQARAAQAKLVSHRSRERIWLNGVIASDSGAHVAITDETGAILRFTPSLEQLLERRIGLTLLGGQIRLPTSQGTSALAAALAATMKAADASDQAAAGASAFIPFSLGDPPAPWAIEFRALSRGADMIERAARGRPAITYGCMTFRSPAAVQLPSIKAIRQAMNLTKTEAVAVQALLAGKSTDEQALQRKVSVDAIRFHQKRIYQKTNTHSSLQASMLAAKLLGLRS